MGGHGLRALRHTELLDELERLAARVAGDEAERGLGKRVDDLERRLRRIEAAVDAILKKLDEKK